MVAGAKFFLALLGISCDTHQICAVRSGKAREKCAEKVRESQGIQIELSGGKPAEAFSSASKLISKSFRKINLLSPLYDRNIDAMSKM